jgi:hypothetical protein
MRWIISTDVSIVLRALGEVRGVSARFEHRSVAFVLGVRPARMLGVDIDRWSVPGWLLQQPWGSIQCLGPGPAILPLTRA